MSNYDMDEIERQKKRERKSRGIEEDHSVEIELPERDILKLALLAHEKGITLSKMINLVIDNGIEKTDYKSENSPQLLNET